MAVTVATPVKKKVTQKTSGATSNVNTTGTASIASTQGEGQTYAPLSSAVDTGANSGGVATTATSTPANTANSGSTYWSEYDLKLPDEAKNVISQAKAEYAEAQKIGNTAAMKIAYNKAQKARAQYGSYIDPVGDGTGYSYFGKDTWSAADQNLPQEAQDKILEYKLGYTLADNDVDRNYYNQMAEAIRNQYGGYTGGTSGMEYNPLGILERQYNDNSQYESQYQDNINSLLSEIQNSQFDYDYATDPSYQSYLDAYTRQGNSASETALARTAAATGGMPSSYAAAVANQMQQAYAKQATDMIPQLEQQAYERYASDLANRLNLANTYGTLDQNAYGQFADNKNFNFGQWQANYNNAYQQDYNSQQMALTREQFEKQLAAALEERNWQTSENALDRELQKWVTQNS